MLRYFNIPGYKYYSDNVPSSLACRMDGCRTVQGHSGHGAHVTSSLTLKPCHVAETAVAGDETVTAEVLLLTRQVHSSHLRITGILLLNQLPNPDSRPVFTYRL